MFSYQEILAAAQALSADDRFRLVDELWEKTPPVDWPVPSAEWLAEVQRRSAAYEAGQMTAATWEDVRVRARRAAGLNE